MTSHPFTGAWYCDATPSGAFVVLYPGSHVQTHFGRIELPPGEPWGVGYVRCTDVGGFKFAGQPHTLLGVTLEWSNGWHSIPQPAVGNSSVIYDRDGVLRISDGSVGSQGWRYVAPDGALVSGDLTYGPLHGLNEYTIVGDLVIGQGNASGGVLVWDGAVLRELATGDARFIRVQARGEAVSLAWMSRAGATIVQTTLAELRSLPPWQPMTPTPPSPPPPVPTPAPAPKEPLPMIIDHADVAKRLYPAGGLGRSLQEIFEFTARVAWELRGEGCGMLVKPSGENIYSYQGTSYSISRVCYPDGHIYKILSDAGLGGTNGPGWSDDGMVDASRYRPAILVASGTPAPVEPPPPSAPPPSVPPPAPAPIDLSPLLAKLDALSADVARLQQQLDALASRPAPAVKFPTYRGRLAYNIALEPQP